MILPAQRQFLAKTMFFKFGFFFLVVLTMVYHTMSCVHSGRKLAAPKPFFTNSCKCNTVIAGQHAVCRMWDSNPCLPSSPCKISTGPPDASLAHLKQLVAFTTTSSVLPRFYTAVRQSSNAIVGRRETEPKHSPHPTKLVVWRRCGRQLGGHLRPIFLTFNSFEALLTSARGTQAPGWRRNAANWLNRMRKLSKHHRRANRNSKIL